MRQAWTMSGVPLRPRQIPGFWSAEERSISPCVPTVSRKSSRPSPSVCPMILAFDGTGANALAALGLRANRRVREDVLEALLYTAARQVILTGLAILICAPMLDRTIAGHQNFAILGYTAGACAALPGLAPSQPARSQPAQFGSLHVGPCCARQSPLGEGANGAPSIIRTGSRHARA